MASTTQNDSAHAADPQVSISGVRIARRARQSVADFTINVTIAGHVLAGTASLIGDRELSEDSLGWAAAELGGVIARLRERLDEQCGEAGWLWLSDLVFDACAKHLATRAAA